MRPPPLGPPREGPRVGGLAGSSRALYLAQREPPLLVVAAGEEEARRLHGDLAFWSAVLGRPAPVLIPPPAERLGAARLAAMERLEAAPAASAVTDLETARAPLPSARALRARALPLRRGEQADAALVAELLGELGYRRVQLVAESGEFAVRVAGLDVFPAASAHPVRLEFAEGALASLRAFEVDSQRSFREEAAVTLLPAVEPREGEEPAIVLRERLRILVGDAGPAAGSAPGPWDLVLPEAPAGPAGGAGEGSPVRGPAGLGLAARERRAGREDLDIIGPRLASLSHDHDVLVAAATAGEAERVRDLLAGAAVGTPILQPQEVAAYTGRIAIVRGRLSGGFLVPGAAFLAITSAELFGAPPPARPRERSHVAGLIATLDELQPGDFVVHVEHGIGRYLGLRRLAVEGEEADFLHLEYAAGGSLYVPAERIDLIRRHHGAGETAPRLDRIGGSAWERTRSRARAKAREVAEEMLRLQAARAAAPGLASSPDGEPHREFAAAFPYEETPDQRAAYDQIRRDMEAPHPMDRLLCGDTGFGKTEVAMRAAFKALCDGRQVAVLAPTTLLAEQHAAVFAARFAAFPARIASLSRFADAAGQAAVLAALAAGEVDIVVGTHRLLGGDVAFRDLGLLIVDEEQKFGAAHKERIRALRPGVDVLTLSATPIPRTLHLALAGVRAISTLETPPEERLAARTVVAPFSWGLAAEALEREFARGGQAFFVHNRIETIARVGARLQRLLPGRRLGMAHARLPEAALEEVMRRFQAGETELLVATAIVGAGLDIPRANTIVVDRADRFGLADLYQLRGRVGRADRRAFAYFLVPPAERLTPEAERRLDALRELSFLGAGFRVALKDLEIRGAGDLLGAEQSGHIEAVGYDLYLEMLQEAVAELTGAARPAAAEPVLALRAGAHLPPAWIEDPGVRFGLLRRVAALREPAAAEELRRELRDRFGPLPREAARLLDQAGLRALCRRAGVASVRETSERRVRVALAAGATVRPASLYAMAERGGEKVEFTGEAEFEVDLSRRSPEEIVRRLSLLLGRLAP